MIFLAAALAAEPPPKPPAPEPVAEDCLRAHPLVIGKPPPAALVVGGLVVCSAVAVPTAEAADLAALEVWGEHVADRYRLDTAALSAELAAAREREAWYKAQARPRPEPVLLLGGGVLVGVGVTLAAAWGMGQVAQ